MEIIIQIVVFWVVLYVVLHINSKHFRRIWCLHAQSGSVQDQNMQLARKVATQIPRRGNTNRTKSGHKENKLHGFGPKASYIDRNTSVTEEKSALHAKLCIATTQKNVMWIILACSWPVHKLQEQSTDFPCRAKHEAQFSYLLACGNIKIIRSAHQI